MKKLIPLLLLSSVASADPYVSVGLGAHDPLFDGPEINLGSSLGIVEAGYEYKGFDLRFTHISGLTVKESGYGLNMISVNYRYYFR